ncbi:MAG TPA: hypothetical protein DCE78_06885 [Bacteroidetes bacterium]|nr:hypothetical protein [Bacteroidota bacterium]
MNIIIGEENAREVDSRYIVLELDTIRISKEIDPIKTYCLIEEITLDLIFNLVQNCELHKNLIKNYRLKNWKFCLNALEHLKGQWNQELDSFYDSLESRILEYQKKDPGPEWNGIIDKF